MQDQDDWIPPTKNFSKVTASINNRKLDSSTTKISRLISCIVTVAIQLTNPTFLNHTLISVPLDLRNMNSVSATHLQNLADEQYEITILHKLSRTRANTSIQEATDMTYNTQIINPKVNTISSLKRKSDLPRTLPSEQSVTDQEQNINHGKTECPRSLPSSSSRWPHLRLAQS